MTRAAILSVAGALTLLAGSAEAMPVQSMQAPTVMERAAIVTTVVRRPVVRRRPATIIRRRVIVR